MYKIVILSVVGAVAVGLGALYLLTTDSATTSPVTETAQTETPITTPPDETQRGVASLLSLMSQARDLECTISYAPENDPTQVVTGTYFTTSGKMRGDFIVPGMASGSVSSMIMTADTMYSWSEINGETYGVKFDTATMAKMQATSSTEIQTNEPVAVDVPVTYECKPWTGVDRSIFEPPSDVLFRDFSEITAAGMEFGTIYEGAESGNATQCELCNQVSAGPGQDECKAAFRCE